MLFMLFFGSIGSNYVFYERHSFRSSNSLHSTQVRNESDPALALLSDYIENKSVIVRTASVCGLGIAYSGIVITADWTLFSQMRDMNHSTFVTHSLSISLPPTLSRCT